MRKNCLSVRSFVIPAMIPGVLSGFAYTDTSCYASGSGNFGNSI